MADNPYINKVVYGDQTLIDLTEDTVSPSSLKLGNTAHDASGAQITGTADDAPKSTVAYIFNETNSYAVSDYVYYENQLYKCTTAHTGTWNAEHFTLTTVGNELNSKLAGLTILSYGQSTWNDFIAAYTANRVVYCRASSNSNPASGSQTRLAFMAYVSNADNPTNVEFQYYRSVGTHTDSQQGDQVFIYKLDKSAGWSVTTRNAFTKIVAGTNMSSSYSNGTITLNADVSGTGDGNGAPKRTIAYIFSESDSYAANDYVYYENQLYICVTAHTGAWNAQHFTLTTVGDELNDKAPKDYIVVQDEEPTNQDTKLWINDQDDNGEEIEVYTTDEVDSKLAGALLAYRTAAAQDVIDAGKQVTLVSGENIKTINEQTILGTGDLALSYSRPNLLDNWYFVGGGSQKGIGVFPINQKGQTTYTASGITIDRWSAGEKVVLSASYTEFVNTSTSARAFYIQKLTTAAATLAGQKCTISILTSDGSLYSATGTVGAAGSGTRSPSIDFNGNSFFLSQDSSGAAATLAVSTGSVRLRAVKLEIGNYQTLAHKEGSTWVLNGIPDYKNELEKCQRYLFVTNYSSANYVGFLGIITGDTTAQGFISHRMNGKPTISPNSGSNWTIRTYNGTTIVPTTITPWFASQTCIGVKFTIPSTTIRGICTISTNSATDVIFSAET